MSQVSHRCANQLHEYSQPTLVSYVSQRSFTYANHLEDSRCLPALPGYANQNLQEGAWASPYPAASRELEEVGGLHLWNEVEAETEPGWGEGQGAGPRNKGFVII
ncbi:rCG58514, isoform CRA_c, partial [Rattus norvegicus]